MTIQVISEFRTPKGEYADADLIVCDAESGLLVVAARPASAPRLWREYLRLALGCYTEWDVLEALDYDAIQSGSTTPHFLAVIDPVHQRLVGGVRLQGPYPAPGKYHATAVEWSGQPSSHALHEAITSRVPEGLVEVKAACVDRTSPDAGAAASVIARLPLIILALTQCRYIMATAGRHTLERWSSGGGKIDESVAPVPYPDERYSTQVMFWDRNTIDVDAQPDCWARMRHQYGQLVKEQAVS